jgi:DNA (cytosine-5)-methyltransferase 1
MERVLGDLAEIGYDAEWESIRASDVGAPHRRERIWIVAYPKRRRGRESTGDTHAAQESLCSSEWAEGPFVARSGGEISRPNSNSIGRRRSDHPMQVYGPVVFRERNAFDDTGEMGNSQSLANDDCARLAQLQGQHASTRSSGRSVPYADSWWKVEPNLDRVVDGVPFVVDRLRGLGNAVVPQIAEWIGRRIMSVEEP